MLQLSKHSADSNLIVALRLFVAFNIINLHSNVVNGAVVQPGWVTPAKAELAIGSDLNITCTINQSFFKYNDYKENCTVEDLYFTVSINGKTTAFKDYPIVERINDTSIRFNARNVEDQEGLYVCMCGMNGINTSRMFVGTTPQLVEDFSCTSYDWEYMVCNFTQPRNSINTRYNLTYTIQENSNYYYNLDCNFDASPLVNCNMSSDDIYKRFSELLYFKLEMANPLGRFVQPLKVNNFERMILGKPGADLLIENITEHSMCLSWRAPRRGNFIGGVLWQVHVTPDDFPTILRPMWPNNSMGMRDILCLNDLIYAGYNYTLDLRVRNNKTKSLWSQPLHYVFRTVAARPERPPRVTDGSFYIYSSEAMLTVYWEQLKKYELNGDNFTYVISEYLVNDEPTDTKNIRVQLNSATIENWNQSAKHEIFIRSSNNVGTSEKASRLVIPPIRDTENTRSREPKNIHSVYHASNSSYSLSWKAPENSKDLINYTVFWCSAMPALQSQCKDSIHFEHVPKDRFQFTTKSDQPASLNMAVSANFVNRNTGMHWTICTQDGTNDLAKMEPSVEEVGNFTLAVKWSTDGVCPSILRGYNLTYCQRSDGKADNCTTKHLEQNAIDYTIRDLEPYTYYSVKMLMYSDTTASKYSDELINRTGEASPTPPRQLEYSQVTNSSVRLAWKPPTKANGVVRDYKITLRHANKTDFIKLRALTEELVDGGAEKSVSHELTNLDAYTLYNISIQACTLYDSEPSNIINFRTAVGVPSKPTLDVENGVSLKWTEPIRPSGRLEFYEVLISEHNANNTRIMQESSYISAKQNRICNIVAPTCTSQHRFFYEVRAVNVEPLVSTTLLAEALNNNGAENSQRQCLAHPALNDLDRKLLMSYTNPKIYRLHKSEWAKHEVSCSAEGSNAKVVMGSIEVLLALIIIIVALQMGYRKYRKMSDIDITLPTGMLDTLKKPIDNSLGMSLGPDGPSGGIICTRIDTAQYMQQYVPQDMPHDFSSGNESSKLLLASNSSGSGGTERDSYEEQPPVSTLPAHTSYMSMSDGLLLDDELNNAPASELHASHTPGGNADTNGYIKPTQMKNWSTPPMGNNAINLPAHMSMPLSGYVPVQVLQAARNNAPVQTNTATTPLATFTTIAPLASIPSSNYVQASDLHKLKALAPTPATTNFAPAHMITTPTAATTAAPPTATNAPPAANIFGYTSMEQLQRFKMNAMPSVGLNPNQQTQQQPNIGGYVTPQDLNALAHNRHML